MGGYYSPYYYYHLLKNTKKTNHPPIALIRKNVVRVCVCVFFFWGGEGALKQTVDKDCWPNGEHPNLNLDLPSDFLLCPSWVSFAREPSPSKKGAIPPRLFGGEGVYPKPLNP